MNKSTNAILTKVAGKLLSHILPEDKAAAYCLRTCFSCVNHQKMCKERCCDWFGCRTSHYYIKC